MRGRLENGEWITPFDDQYPYYEYMYREANAWQQAFFAPHDTEGLIGLFPSREAFGEQLDKLFSIPWKGYEVDNLSCFIGQYCRGNQPDHSFPYLYYFIGRQERSQELLDYILDRFYGMGPEAGAVRYGRCGRDVVVVRVQCYRPLHLFAGRPRIYRDRAAVRQGAGRTGRRQPLDDPPRRAGT